MSLPTNPLATIVARISAEFTPAANAVKSSLTNTQTPNVLDKANLDRKINDLSGGIGSGSNWAGVGGGFQGGGYGSIGAGQTALGGKTSGIQSLYQKVPTLCSQQPQEYQMVFLISID